jgi:hypothetical protein
MTDSGAFPALVSASVNRVRPVAAVVVLAGIGLSVTNGKWSIAVGLGVTTVLLLGPLVSYVKNRVKAPSDRVTPLTTGTMATAGVLGTLPALIVGAVCVLASSKYWWVGFPAGMFFGIGVFDVALYAAMIAALHKFEASSGS